MNNKPYLYLASFILVLASVLLCAAGCGAHAGGQAGVMNRNSQLPSQRQPSPPSSSSTEAAIVRFVAEPTELPLPDSEGSFVDEQHTWVNDAGKLKRTNDGGRTWQLVRPTPQDEQIFGRVQDTYVRPYFITPTRGWLKAGSGIWQTEDSGLTWRRIFAESSTPQFADTRHGWIDVFVAESSEQSYTTQDGGLTWQPCGSVRSTDRQLPSRAYFLTQQLGWAITSRTIDRQTIYGVAHTVDGGCQWQQLWVSDGNPDERYNALYFLNEREGWLAGEFNLYHTTNGGRSWRAAWSLDERSEVVSVYFADSKDGWVITADRSERTANIYHSVDGGRTWQQLTKNEIINGSGIPTEWKAGRLLQTLYADNHVR